MKHLLLSLTLGAFALTVSAQNAREEIAQNPGLAGNQSCVYPVPQTSLTPTPKGYTPFYMSHYGRHGSRYNWEYKPQVETLLKAQRLGKLTPLGEETLHNAILLRDEAEGRYGELTELGAEQHRDIACRMYQNFPEIFAGKTTTIDARSTIVVRCILSMENAMQQFSALNPQLRIRHDASEHDMYYMNHSDKQLDSIRNAGRREFFKFAMTKVHPDRLMKTLFNDEAYWKDSLMAPRLMQQLFSLATHVQNTELRHQINMYPLFTTDELYDLWQIGNANWYMEHCYSPLTLGKMPYSQAPLVRQMIMEADSCLQLNHPSASLRYGHDGMVMPLTCLLELDGWTGQYALDELADKGWRDYKIIPMACNIQFIFYQPKNPSQEILVKVLRNEVEAHLPAAIPTDQWPYYKWSDVRSYYLNKLDAAGF